MNDIHTCSYDCTRPACIKAQRDELREKVEGLEARVRELEATVDELENEILAVQERME